MIQQKKIYRFSDDTVITEQNIRQIGELIALSSVRTRMIHSTRDLYYVFQNLYKDIYCHTDILKPYSEAYDYAEEAICFLCRFIGKKLGDFCIGKFGKPLPIRLACYRHLGRMLWKKYNKNAKYEVGSYLSLFSLKIFVLNCRCQAGIKTNSTVQTPFFKKSTEMQLLNSNIPQGARTTKYSNKKAQNLLSLVLFVCCSFFVLQRWQTCSK